MKKHLESLVAIGAVVALWLLGVLVPALAVAPPAQAAAAPDQAVAASVTAEVQRLADGAARAVAARWPQARIEIDVGTPDPRLRLSPCARTEAYLPAGSRLWGKGRIGVRCVQGERAWNITVPVTVRVWAQALAAAVPLPAGTELRAEHLRTAEVDVAAVAEPLLRAEEAIGRTLARPLAAGDGLAADDLRARRFFEAGDTVRIVAVGAGYAVSAQGQALGHGVEGRAVRVRTETGRVVTGVPVAEHRVEVAL